LTFAEVNSAKYGRVVKRRNEPRTSTLASGFLFALGLLFFVLPTLLLAQAQRALTKDALDAVLVLDSSGSMLQTDPKRLRDQGAKLFTQFLKEEDRFGIIEFSDTVKLRRPIKSYNPIEIADIDAIVASVGSSGYFTDIAAGLREAKDVLVRDGLLDSKKVIVLLSDGKLDPDPESGMSSDQSLQYLRETLLPEIKDAGIVLYTLALSDQSDRKLLAESAEFTGGISWYTANPEDIHKSFADLFLAVKKPQILPLTSKGFQVDADVSEATFYMNNEKRGDTLTLQTPSGILLDRNERREGLQWFRGEKFDIITIKKPEVGNWKVLGIPDQDGYATVLTKLKLLTDWETSHTAGSPTRLQARLYEGTKPVELPEISPVIRFLYQVVSNEKVAAPVLQGEMRDDGKEGDPIASDGVFSSELSIAQPGEYKLKVIARSPTFERSQQVPFLVKPRIIVLRLQSNEDAPPLPDGSLPPSELFRVELGKDVLSMTNIEVQLTAVDEKRRTLRLPLKIVEGERNQFEVATSLLPKDGTYVLTASMTALAPNGKLLRERSDDLEYTKKSEEGENAASEIVLVQEKAKPKPPEPSSLPVLLAFVIVLAVLGGTGIVLFVLLKQQQKKSSEEIPEYQASGDIVAAIERLRVAAGRTEVNIEDSILQPEALAQIKRPESTSAALAAAQVLRQNQSGAMASPSAAAPNAEEAQSAVQASENAGGET
jgi:uncharacterized protein (TIGR03503 family)